MRAVLFHTRFITMIVEVQCNELMDVVYFSSVSENTHRFVGKLQNKVEVAAYRIPLRRTDPALIVTRPYVLILPSYGGGDQRGVVPKQVIKFLNVQENRTLIRGVVISGNTNFGVHHCCAGPIVAKKCGVPILHRFELLGTARDVDTVADLFSSPQSVLTATT